MLDIIQLVTLLERSCAQRATIVRILSKSFIDGVKRLGVADDRIRLIYDWVDTDLITPMPKVNAFSIEKGLDKDFVVLYAGNMSFSQGLENVLEAARLLVNEQIRFVLVGEGAARDSLRATADWYPNVA